MAEELDGYEFITTEDNDVMLIIYARTTDANDAVCSIDAANHSLTLVRNSEDTLTLQGIGEDISEILSTEDALLVCELIPSENPEESEIVRAYEARINH